MLEEEAPEVAEVEEVCPVYINIPFFYGALKIGKVTKQKLYNTI